MAAIDPNIALGYRPIQVENPVNQFAKMQELQLGQAKMQEYQRGLEEQNVLRQLVKEGLDPNTPEFAKRAYQVSPELGIKVAKSQAELNKARYEADKLKGDVIDSRLKQSRAMLEYVTTPEQFLAWHEANHRDDVLGPLLASRGITVDQARARIIENLKKPGGLDRLIQESKLGVEKFADWSNTRRSQDLTYSAATQPVFSEATGGFVTRPDAQGNVKVIPIANPEDTKKGKETNIAKGNVADIAQTMATSYTKLRNMGAMKSVESGAGANLAAGTQSSAVGQLLGGVFGTAEQQERDYIKSQRPLLVQAIVKATGMTASQINSNAELKNLLDAATDPSKGYETNIRTLNDLNKRFGTGTPISIALPKDQNAPAAPAAPQDKSPTKANAAKLLPPVNAQGWTLHVDKNGNRAYVGPNGQIQEVK